MAKYPLKDKAAIVGIGWTKPDRLTNMGPDYGMYLLGQSYKAALEDCGLKREEVDGIISGGGGDATTMEKLPEFLGTDTKRFVHQKGGHGRHRAIDVAIAAMALDQGLANYIAIPSAGIAGAVRERLPDSEQNREGYGPHGEAPAWRATSVITGPAMSARIYMNKYGYSERELGAVPVSHRHWANRNPNAFFYKQPLTIEDYLQGRYILEPFRLYDCSLWASAGFTVIMTTADRARNLRKPPIYVSGVQGSMAGRDQFVYGRQGLGSLQQRTYTYEAPDMLVYRMAEVKPEDIDMFSCLDSFSPVIPWCLELYGFCKDGEGLAFCQNGRIAPGGKLPVNPSGGSFGEGYFVGWGSLFEMIRQLRGEPLQYQIPDVEVALFGSTDGNSFIMHK